jgi:succinate dehydrogenase / fumarate reductase, membrane anchor subunit
MDTKSSFQTDTSAALGLGTAHHGLHHWWMQRFTAVLLVVLIPWLLWQVVCLDFNTITAVQAWVGSPVHGGMLWLTILTMLYHARLGVQTVIEDYVHKRCFKIATLLFFDGIALVIAAICTMSIVSLVSNH